MSSRRIRLERRPRTRRAPLTGLRAAPPAPAAFRKLDRCWTSGRF